jgi:hypothetical protein
MRVDPSKVIPTSDDNAESWIVFHKALKSWFGKQAANAWFLKFWNQRAGAGTSADTHDIREYMDEEGVDLTTDFKGEVTDFGMGIVDWFGDTASVLRAVAVGTVVLGVGLIAYYIIKSTNKGKSVGEMVYGSPISLRGSTRAIGGSKSLGAPSSVKLLS